MNRGFSSKTAIEKRFAFRQAYFPEHQNTSTLRKQCGAFGETEAESFTERLYQTAFAIGGMRMKYNTGGFRTKTARGYLTSTATSTWLKSIAFTLQLSEMTNLSFTMNPSPIRAGNCFHIHHTLPLKPLPRQSIVEILANKQNVRNE